MWIKNSVAAFSAAWQMLLDWPLPGKLAEYEMPESEAETLAVITLCAFPVIGLIFGLLVMLLGVAVTFAAAVPAAIIFAFVMTVLCELRDSGRSLGALASFASLKIEGRSVIEALFNIDSDLKNLKGAVAVAILVLAILFKFLYFFLMSYYGFYFWAVAVFILGYMVQSDLALLPALRTGEPFVNIRDNRSFMAWGVAVFFLLFVLFQAPSLTLATMAAVFVCSFLFRRYCEHFFGGVSSNTISLAGYFTELGVLLAGVIFLCTPAAA